MDNKKHLKVFIIFIATFLIFNFLYCVPKESYKNDNNSLAIIEVKFEEKEEYFPPSLSCNNIPYYFSSYEEATRTVRSKKYKIKDILDPVDSDWIASAEFYSCDGKVGYFIYTTIKGSRDYIHEKLPYQLFLGFKNADSPGSYYRANIKKKYAFSHRIK